MDVDQPADLEIPGPRERILVVDQFARDAEAIARVARSLGHPTVVLNHPSAFDVAYRSFKPSLIILDLYLPQFDGIDAARWLAERNNRAPLVLISHQGSLFARAAKAIAELAGFPVRFFAKPLSDALIHEMLAADETAVPPPGCKPEEPCRAALA